MANTTDTLTPVEAEIMRRLANIESDILAIRAVVMMVGDLVESLSANPMAKMMLGGLG
jgi:hypothetical protein